MAITKTNETLMLLKGSRANLASMAVSPGAIYFTTDYPGIYVDLAAEGAQGQSGYKPARRMRMGDVTVVDNLAVLQNLVNLISGKDGLSTWNPSATGNDKWSASEIDSAKSPSTTPILTDKALYYAIAENVLCMYDQAGKRFVWINDHTELNQAISALSTAINGTGGLSARLTTAENDIDNIEQTIGTSADAATSNTIYGKIKAVDEKIGTSDDESTAATVYGAISNIQDQIDEITGGDDGSISDLQDQIDGLVAADTTLENKINKVYGDTTNGVPDAPTATVLGNASEIIQINNKLGENFETNAQVNRIESVSVKINGSNTELAKKTDKAVTVTLPNTLASYDGGKVIDGIQSNIADAEHAINKVYHGSADAPAGGYTASVTGNAQAISNLKGNTSTANTVLGNAQAISDLKGNASTANTVLGNAQAISNLKGKSSDTSTGTVLGNANAIGGLQQSVTNIGSASIAAGKTDKEGTASGYIETVRKIALAQAKDYADTQIDSKIAAANSMTFKNAVNAINDLPTTNVNAGDTYVVAADISVGGTITYHIGDLFIAATDQGSITSYPRTILSPGATGNGWFWIKTGYDAHFEPSLDTKTSSDSVDPTITLLSHVGTDLGAIKLTDAGKNIQIETIAKGENTPAEISFKLVWATF